MDFGKLEAEFLDGIVFLEEDSSTYTYLNYTDKLKGLPQQSGAPDFQKAPENWSTSNKEDLNSNKENINTQNTPIASICPSLTKKPLSLFQKISSSQTNHQNKVPPPIALPIPIPSAKNSQLEIVPEILEKTKELRTTIMMRNIPNRYDIKSLLELIEPEFKGTFDFVYVPIDFKNKCNMGYAFINFTDTRHLVRFYKRFHQKTWSHVHSLKVCCVCFARIQGRNNLISHFKRTNYLRLNLEPAMLPFIVPNPSEDFFIF